MRISDWSSDVCSSDLEKTTLASTKLIGTSSPHGTDTKGFARALYWAGMAASNLGGRHRQAAGWLSRSAKFKKDEDVLSRLAELSFQDRKSTRLNSSH